MCHFIENFCELETPLQVRVGWVLAKLCLNPLLADLIPENAVARAHESDAHASLAYLRALARYRLNLEVPSQPYSIREFERIAEAAPPGVCHIDAHYQMVVQGVKQHNNLSHVERWQPLHLRAIERSRDVLDEFTHTLVMTRFHRVGGFLPQMRRDPAGTVDEMERSEAYARALERSDEVHTIVAKEMLYPVLESRIKEALWLKDFDKALARAEEITELCPSDARAWLHRGQVHVAREEAEEALRSYRNAARLAPPGREVALFMAGQCLEALERDREACDAYVMALEADALGISSVERLMEVSERLGERALHRWARDRFAALRAEQERTEERPSEAYKNLPPPMPASEARVEA